MTVFHFSMVVFVCICGVLELANGAKHTQSLLYSTRCFDLTGRLNISSRLHLQTNYGNMNFMIEWATGTKPWSSPPFEVERQIICFFSVVQIFRLPIVSWGFLRVEAFASFLLAMGFFVYHIHRGIEMAQRHINFGGMVQRTRRLRKTNRSVVGFRLFFVPGFIFAIWFTQ